MRSYQKIENDLKAANEAKEALEAANAAREKELLEKLEEAKAALTSKEKELKQAIARTGKAKKRAAEVPLAARRKKPKEASKTGYREALEFEFDLNNPSKQNMKFPVSSW
jgi:hypothetical protein